MMYGSPKVISYQILIEILLFLKKKILSFTNGQIIFFVNIVNLDSLERLNHFIRLVNLLDRFEFFDFKRIKVFIKINFF